MSVLNISWSGSFPFCLIPAAGLWDQTTLPIPSGMVGPGTQYPVGLSLDQAMRWYWQVETWQCTAAFSFSGTRSDGGTPSTFSDSLADTLTIPRAVTQTALVCPTGFNANDGPTTLQMWGSSPYAYTLDGLIYPFLVVDFSDSYLSIDTCAGNLTFPKPWPGTLTVDGQALALWYDEASSYDSTSGVPGDKGPWTQSKSGSATVTAVATY